MNIAEKINKETLDFLFEKSNTTPIEAVLVKCFDCCAYAPNQSKEHFNESKSYVLECKSNCVLNKFLNGEKFGTKKTPRIRNKANWTEEQREAARQRLALRRQDSSKNIENNQPN